MTEVKDKIRFAVVGLGHIGKRHADMIQAHDDCCLCAIVDIDEEVRTGYDIPYYNSLNKLLQSGIETDVVCIATPNSLHAQQAIDAISNGNHVILEKPIALTTKDCEAISNTAEENNKKVFCVMQNRYSASVQWLKELLSSGKLGKTYMVHVNCFWNRDDRYYHGDTWHGTSEIDGGTLFTQFSHYIDLLYWLFGDIEDIHARFDNYNHENSIEFEDSAILSFEFKNGGAGTLNYTTSIWDKNMESSLVVIGEKGTVKLGGQYMQEIEYCHVEGSIQPDIENKEISIAGYDGAKVNHWYVIDNVVNVLQGNAEISTNVEEGKKIVNIIERIYALKK